MSSMHFYLALCFALITYGIYRVSELEVNHEDFPIEFRHKVNADSAEFFHFLMQEHVLEKLLPWLTRFKQADSKILSVGKIYRAFLKLPILGIGRIHLSVSEYRAPKLLVLESSDSVTRQRIEIRSKRYHDHTILQSTVYLRKTSAIYQYTVGLALRYHIARHLEKSTLTVAEIYKAVEESRKGSTFHSWKKNI